jgi:hypothetical protein
LSRDFGIAHYFYTHRVVEYHVWARAERGTLIKCQAHLQVASVTQTGE